MESLKKRSIIVFILGLTMILSFTPLGAFTSKVYAATMIDRIDIESTTTSVEAGALPSFDATTATEHATIEAYGSNTCWHKWKDGASSWSGFGSDYEMAVNDGKTHYGLRIHVNISDDYQFSDSAKVYFNDEDVTTKGHTEIKKYSWGGYVIIDLGLATGDFVTANSYEELKAAVDGCDGSDGTDLATNHVKLGADITVPASDYLRMNVITDFILDLNGYTLDVTNNDASMSICYGSNRLEDFTSGSLTITDTSASQTGTINVGYKPIFVNQYNTSNTGMQYKLTIDGGKFYGKSGSNNSFFEFNSNEYYWKDKLIIFDFKITKGYFEHVSTNMPAIVLANDSKLNNVTFSLSFDNLTFKAGAARLMTSNETYTMNDVVPEDTNFYIFNLAEDKQVLITERTMDATTEVPDSLWYEVDGYTDLNYCGIKLVKQDGFNVTAPTFDNVEYGYSSVSAKSISIYNRGTSDLQVKSVAVDDTSKFTVTGSTEPTITSKDTDNTSFTIQPVDGLNAGTHTATITVTDMADNTYKATVSFSVEPKDIKSTLVISAIADQTYKGENIEPKIEVKDGTTLLALTTDYTVSYENNLNRGTATVKITKVEGSNYTWTGEMSQTFIINPKTITPTIEEIDTKTYTGNLIEPTIVVKDGTTPLDKNTDYEVTFVNNQNAGTATVKVTAKAGSNYTWGGEVTKDFTINPMTITPTIADIADVTFNNEEQTPEITVTVDSKTLEKDIDYTVIYENNIYVGTAKVKVTAKEGRNYTWTGELTKNFKINTATSVISGSPANVTDSTNTSAVVLIGKTLDISTFVTLNPSEYQSDLTFTITDVGSTGASLDTDGKTLKGATTEGTVAIKASFTGMELNSDSNLEYSPATDLTIYVKVVDKEEVTIGGLTYADKVYDGAVVTPTGTLEVSDNKVSTNELIVKYEKFDSSWTEITELSANVGKYRVTYSVSDTNENYTGSKSYEFEITVKKLTKPTLEGTYTYTGSAQTATLTGFDGTTMEVSNNTRTDAGSQNIEVTLKDITNYSWDDDTTTALEIPFEIAKEKLTKPILEGTYTYTGEEQTAVLVNVDNETMNVTNNTRTEAGSQDITVSLKDIANYAWADGTTTDVTFPFVIAKATPTIVLENLSQKEGSVTAVTYTVTPANTDGTVKVEYKVSTEEDSTYTETLPTTKGTYTVRVTVAGDSNLEDTQNTATLTITRKTTSGGGGGSSAPTKYTITVKQNSNGKISPETVKVEKGNDKTFEIKANAGYEIEDVKVDSESVGAVKEYTFENVKAAHTIEATFKKVEEVAPVEPEDGWKNPFVDVSEDDWYYEAVKFANENKLFNGVSENEFGANVKMTRGMLVTVLYRLAGEPATNKSIPFADVDTAMYYANPISWAKQNGIVNGVDENNFAPDAEISRQQLVTILYRFAKLMGKDVSVGEDTNILSYDDVNQVAEYAIPAMQWACGDGVITGRTESTLAPIGNATRAEVATMLMRFINN